MAKKRIEKPFYNVREVAEHLGVVPQLVRRWIKEGRLPTVPGVLPYLIEAQHAFKRPKSLTKYTAAARKQLSGPLGKIARAKKRATKGAATGAKQGATKKASRKGAKPQ
jgi:transposase-like protein